MILQHREVDPTELSAKELVQRNRRNKAKLGAVVLWLNDSISWMEAATLVDERSGRRETKGELLNHSHLNVAYVAAGYAYELAIMRGSAPLIELPALNSTNPWAWHQLSVALMFRRTRRHVSGLVLQIGVRTARTSSRPILSTGRSPGRDSRGRSGAARAHLTVHESGAGRET